MAEASGTLNSGSALIAAVRGKWRLWVLVAGFGLWFGWIALETGTGAFVALWKVALLIGALVLITIPTRTVTVVELLAPFSLGGAIIGLSLLAGWAFDLMLGTKETPARALGMPLVDELLKILPVLWILWRQRRGRALTFGATDVLLLAACSGAGFYFVETAFIIHNRHSSSFVGWFPTTDLLGDGHLIASHALWTAIAGITIGIAWFLRRPRFPMLLIAASGWLWSALDHGANNYGANYQNAFASALRVITGNGYLSMYIFLLGVGVALALDVYFAYVAAPAPSKAELPAFPASWDAAKRVWRYSYLRRQYAYAVARYNRADGLARERLAGVIVSLSATLRKWRPSSAATNRPPS